MSTAEAEAALKLNRPTADSTWVTGEELGEEALKIAQDSMEQDRIIEYSCYDDQGNPQGRAVLKLMDWEDKDEGLLVAGHGECSDEYYQWYAQHQLTKGEGAIYHICRSSARKCKFKLPRRDKRTVIHLDRWRLMSPATMLAADYLKVVGSRLGKEQLALAAEDKKRRRDEQDKGHPSGTGIDGALDDARANVPPFPPPPAPSEEKRGRDKEKRSDKEKDKRRKRSLSEQLAENVKRSQEAERSRSRKRKSKKKKEAKRSKKKRGLDESSSESGRSSSSESSHFQSAPARGGDLWRIAQKKPGQLATRSLNEMIRFLAERSEGGAEGPTWAGQKVLAYLNQVVLVNHPPSKIGPRSHRELVTLAMSVDEILSGNLKKALDLLLQRFKALETSLLDGGWHTARHLELIPAASASLTTENERHIAAKAELQSIKLKEAMSKAQKQK